LSVHTVVQKDGAKTYKVRWREGGVNRARHFDRLKDARTWDSEVRRRRQSGELVLLTAGSQTLTEYASKWWEDYAEQHLAPRTLDVYAVQLDLRIAPTLGGYRLRKITPGMVQEFLGKLRRDGVGDASVIKTATVLQSILNRAVIDGLIERNPVAVVRKPSQRRKRQPDLVIPDTVELIRINLGPFDATLVSVLAYAGLRPESEAVTLIWGQVGKRSLRIDASKTGRVRHVRLLEPLAEDLAEWRRACGSPAEGTLVFPRGTGAWDRNAWRNWLRRVYRPAAIKAGLDEMTRPRDLRGSFASLLIWEGQTVVEVAQQLGNSAETCLRDYAGVFAEFSIEDRVSAEQVIRDARAKVRPR
jgi:site-specific recombinase XerC